MEHYHVEHNLHMTAVLVEGVFDLAHVGHFNAFRKARGLADRLVVGINSDETVEEAKGTRPIFSVTERAEILSACKFVDQVIQGLDYYVTFEWFESTGIDFIAHGDDDVLVDGRDLYAPWKAAGKFKSFSRTCGVSTTALLARIHTAGCVLNRTPVPAVAPSAMHSMTIGTREVAQFASPLRIPKEDDRVVYVDGCFDILHPGLIRQLRAAKLRGTYLIVGVFDDASCRELYKHECFPVLGLMERVLSVLSLRVVDDVVIGAPLAPSPVFMHEQRINVVVERERCPVDFSHICDLEVATIPVEPSTAEVYARVSDANAAETLLRIERKRLQEEQYYDALLTSV